MLTLPNSVIFIFFIFASGIPCNFMGVSLSFKKVDWIIQ